MISAQTPVTIYCLLASFTCQMLAPIVHSQPFSFLDHNSGFTVSRKAAASQTAETRASFKYQQFRQGI